MLRAFKNYKTLNFIKKRNEIIIVGTSPIQNLSAWQEQSNVIRVIRK
jgi:hypothetical protein